MSFGAEQIKERGKSISVYRGYHNSRYQKFQKKSQHKVMRQRMKKLDFIPQYNRYDGGWYN